MASTDNSTRTTPINGTSDTPTPSSAAPSTTNTTGGTAFSSLPEAHGKKKPARPPSMVWDHFTKIKGADENTHRAKCNYCGKDYACSTKKNGTSNMLRHLTNQCKKNPFREQKRQKTLCCQAKKNEEDTEVGLIAVSFSQDACRDALAKMIIIDELPFNHVAKEGFRQFCNVGIPRFAIPSRWTVARDCLQLYMKEKKRLKDYFVKSGQRICITTDTWTSIQNLNYMCVTVHFIDGDWNLQKRIISFCLVPNHKGDTIGKSLEMCLLEWGIEKVFTVTVDNASSNDRAVAYLVKKVNNWNAAILKGEYMHVRCCAHIVNLIVTDGLKDVHGSITRIRKAVRYVRASPARTQKFKDCAEKEKITSKSLLCLDVPTRWNSTYYMLEAAVKFQKAFKRLEETDGHFLLEFRDDECRGPPTIEDWDNTNVFIQFLKFFHDVTLRFSGSLFATSNLFVNELCVIQTQLDASISGDELLLCSMAENMKRKFDKYWGNMRSINPYLLVAVLLDPRHKEHMLKICFGVLCDDLAVEMTNKVRATLNRLYEQYSAFHVASHGQVGSASQSQNEMEVDKPELDARTLFTSRYKKLLKDHVSVGTKTEVDRYLMESCEDVDDANFDILGWWKINTSRFRILSQIARDILAIPVSTVASESAFSTGGRILNSFRSSLSPKTVEALICTQNWIRSSKPINLRESMDEIQKLESELLGNLSDLTIVDE